MRVHRAREVATFSLLRLYRNSVIRNEFIRHACLIDAAFIILGAPPRANTRSIRLWAGLQSTAQEI
jgi:hypothetical protein